jgi:hypothetical protein
MFSRWKRKKGELSRVESSRVELVPCSGKAALDRIAAPHPDLRHKKNLLQG